MSDWTARIDALPEEGPAPLDGNDTVAWLLWAMHKANCRADRLALAAERLREPHEIGCWSRTEPGASCFCGKDSDLLRILEGK